MKGLWRQKEYLVIAVVILLFLAVSILSLVSIRQLQGNARVINYVGIVRGATQKLVKKELHGDPDDLLIVRLDSIVDELLTGEGPNNLIVLHDEDYIARMREVLAHWVKLKAEIQRVRQGDGDARLYAASEKYFTLVDGAVSSAENYTERQVDRSIAILVGVVVTFLAIIFIGIVFVIRSLALKKRAETLNKIAYLDPLTQMENRASCERLIGRCKENPPAGDLAVFMFDMNNLKHVNDRFGHKGGDRLIAEFARILRAEAEAYGFVGRYGGDEFLAVFEDATHSKAESFLMRVNERVVVYNMLHVSDLEKISFAEGFVVENLRNQGIDEMIHEADGRMYARKRQMKENRDMTEDV